MAPYGGKSAVFGLVLLSYSIQGGGEAPSLDPPRRGPPQ